MHALQGTIRSAILCIDRFQWPMCWPRIHSSPWICSRWQPIHRRSNQFQHCFLALTVEHWSSLNEETYTVMPVAFTLSSIRQTGFWIGIIPYLEKDGRLSGKLNMIQRIGSLLKKKNCLSQCYSKQGYEYYESVTQMRYYDKWNYEPMGGPLYNLRHGWKSVRCLFGLQKTSVPSIVDTLYTKALNHEHGLYLLMCINTARHSVSS